MGGTNSTPSKVQSVPVKETPTAQELAFEQQLKEAYEKGKDDGLATVQQSLSAVAAQTFDSIHQHLNEVQTKQLENSKILAESLEKKLQPPKPLEKGCKLEESALIACLNTNKKDTLVCNELVDKYSYCSLNILQKS